MEKYYQFISFGSQSDSVIWTEPYLDSQGLGEMTTAAIPVYYYNNNNFKILIGVIGIDVLMTDFTTFETSKEVVKTLVFRSNGKCQKINLSQCNLENLRGYKNFFTLFF